MKLLGHVKSFSYLLCATLLLCSYNLATAGQHPKPPVVLGEPGAGLNKIFSTSNPYGPLGQDRNLVENNRILMLWNEPPSTTDTTYDAFHYQILGYNPASKQLSQYGSLSGDSVTDAANGTAYPAIGGNRNSVVVAGDMIGDGYAEEASVWETANHKIFASAMPISKTDLTFEDSSVTGKLVGSLTSTISDYSGEVQATLADLTGNGKKDLVIAWDDPTDNKVDMEVYGWSETAASHLALIDSIADMSVNTSAPYTGLIALAAGEFKQDSCDEIALAGFSDATHLYIKLYYLNSSNSLIPAAEQTFSYSVADSTGNAPSGNILRLSMGTGDFTGNNYKDCIALAYTSSGNSTTLSNGLENGALFIARPDTSLESIAVYTDDAFAFSTLGEAMGASDGVSLQCGDLLGSGTDQVVICTDSDLQIFNVEEDSSYLKPVGELGGALSLLPSPNGFIYSNSFMRVGDINRDGKDEIVILQNVASTINSVTEQYLNLYVYAFSGTGLSPVASLTHFMPETLGASTAAFMRHYSLALGNFDNAGLRLGVPTLFHAANVVQPLVILNAPPVQFDVFNDSSYDVCRVFNGGAGNFSATYSQSTTNASTVESTVNSSWGVGASLSGKLSYAGSSVEASLDTHYGKNFSKEQNSSYQNSVSMEMTAQEDDEIYAIMDNYDIWEYPLLDSGQVKGHVLVTVPGPPIGEWFDTEAWTGYSFVPDHVVGNVLSYQDYDSVADNPYLDQQIKGNLSSGDLLGTGTFGWSLTQSSFQESSADTSQKFDLNVSTKATVGADFGGFGAELSVGVSGDYSNSSLTSHTTSVGNSLSMGVNLGPINQSIGEDQYTIFPYSYWGKNGALVIDYAVEPNVASPGQPETWWQQMYGQAPDPAFALPYLNWPQEGFKVQDAAQIHETKEIFCSPQNPAPGDTVTTTVRIHNYSLVATPKPVYTSFYVGDPQNGGTIIKDISGDSVFATPGPIAARGWQVFSFKWVAPSKVHSNLIQDGDYVHIWGIIDSTSTMKEVHKRNDMGWSSLEIPGVTTGVEGHANVPASFQLYQNYPNPFNPTTVIRFDLNQNSKVALEIYNVLGQKVIERNYGTMNAGSYNESINMDRFASGVYFYRIVANGTSGKNFVAVKKLMLLK